MKYLIYLLVIVSIAITFSSCSTRQERRDVIGRRDLKARNLQFKYSISDSRYYYYTDEYDLTTTSLSFFNDEGQLVVLSPCNFRILELY